MTIKTKFDKGDEVYLLHKNTPVLTKINDVSYSRNSISYGLNIAGENITKYEHQLFATIKEFLESIKKNLIKN